MTGTRHARRTVLVSAVLTAVVAATGITPANAGTTMRGTYRTLAIDGPRIARVVPQLVVGHTAYRLDLGTRPAGVAPGQRVVVYGRRTGDVVHVARITATGPAPAAEPVPAGPFSVLVIFASWQGPDAVTQAQAADIIGTEDSSFYAATSFGHFAGFVPTETPWLTIPDPGSCDFEGIKTSAEAAATAAGYTPASYDRELIYAPDQTNYCSGFSGKADLPGRVVEIYRGYMQIGVTSHELGHTFGLSHSNALLCTDAAGNPVTLSSDCTTRAYGDVFDTMGSTFQFGPHGRSGGFFNAMETSNLGWLSTPEIRSVATSQTATLVPYESQGSGLHALALAGDEGAGTFYVEYRRPTGWDDLSGYPLGLIVHRSYGPGTDLLDMTPGTDGGMTDAPLPSGRSWTGPYAADPTITLVSSSETSATVRVTYALRPPGIPRSFVQSPYAKFDAATPAAPAVIAWTPTATPGVCSYQLQRTVNGGAFANVRLPAPDAIEIETPVRGGTDYRFRVRAVTCAGVPSAWATGAAFHVSLLQQGKGSYAGAWSQASRGTAWGGTVETTTAAGAGVTFHTNARSIGIIGTGGPGYGAFREYVDGLLVTTIDANAPEWRPHEIIARWRWDTVGSHTIRLVNVATKGHPRLDVDGFVVLR